MLVLSCWCTSGLSWGVTLFTAARRKIALTKILSIKTTTRAMTDRYKEREGMIASKVHKGSSLRCNKMWHARNLIKQGISHEDGDLYWIISYFPRGKQRICNTQGEEQTVPLSTETFAINLRGWEPWYGMLMTFLQPTSCHSNGHRSWYFH